MPALAIRTCLAAALLALQPRAGVCQAAPDTVHLLIDSGLFTGVNARDAEAAIAVWAHVISREIPVSHALSVALAPGLEACVEAVASGEVDVVGLSAVRYLEHRQELQADPMMVGVRGADDQATDEFVLLAPAAASGPGLADLAGRAVVIGTVDEGSTAAMWLDVLLWTHGLPAAESHLDLRSTDKPSDAMIRVLFGGADACVVTRRAFEAMAELNPQVRRDLQVVATSPGYLAQVACFRRGADPELRAELIRAALALTTVPEGRQILDLFGCERPAEFAAHHLAATEALVAEHRRLSRQHGEGKGAPGRNP
ncbi:MAG: PhnD/SsuA/transferrin family substrate-binding protein [Gemmatimonadota bacterium]